MFPFIAQRLPGYSLLSGYGIEIGAFEHPAKLPPTCRVEYCDAITPEQAQQLFPEIDTSKFVKVDHIIDLNREGLSKFPDNHFDFVIFNHVIEHLANPIYIVSEVLRTLKYGGMMVIAAPDKNHTFDRNRPLTPWEHLKNDYDMKVTDSVPEDYRDILTYINPQTLTESPERIQLHLQGLKNRREHLHVWDSATFRDFLDRTVKLLDVEAIPLYERVGSQNGFEYFGVWGKGGEELRARYRPKSSIFDMALLTLRKAAARYKEGGVGGVLSAVRNRLARAF